MIENQTCFRVSRSISSIVSMCLGMCACVSLSARVCPLVRASACLSLSVCTCFFSISTYTWSLCIHMRTHVRRRRRLLRVHCVYKTDTYMFRRSLCTNYMYNMYTGLSVTSKSNSRELIHIGTITFGTVSEIGSWNVRDNIHRSTTGFRKNLKRPDYGADEGVVCLCFSSSVLL